MNGDEDWEDAPVLGEGDWEWLRGRILTVWAGLEPEALDAARSSWDELVHAISAAGSAEEEEVAWQLQALLTEGPDTFGESRTEG